MKHGIVLLCVCLSATFADFKRTSGLVDIPTGRILPHLGYRIGADFTAQLGSGDFSNVFEENMHASLGLGGFLEVYFDVYTIIEDWTVAGGFCNRLIGTDKFALAWGIHSISTLPDLSEIGQDAAAGWHDDQFYEGADYDKPYERFSGFVLSTFAMSKKVDITLGVGRGRYVGYGATSRYFNSNFYHEQGGDWGVGLFGGVEYKLSDALSLMVEGDGRDVNAGVRFRPLPWEFCVGLTKIEYFAHWDEYRPRVAVSASYMRIPKAPLPGIIAGTVRDNHGNALVASVVTREAALPPVRTDQERGSYQLNDVKPGLYELTASADGYTPERNKVEAIGGQTVYCDFILYKLTGGIIGRVVDANTDEPLAAHVAVRETDLSVDTDPAGAFGFSDLDPDYYMIDARAPRYHSGEAAAEVLAGTTVDVLIRLVPISFDLEGIRFDFDRSTLRPESYSILDHAAEILKQYPEISVEIQGHTCSLGSDEYNLRLSGSRANSVLNYLVNEQKIDRTRLTAKGYGESKPIASNETSEGRERNRRVDFVVLE